MKSINVKTADIVAAYRVLDGAKYQKLGDEDKVRLWKISRKLSPVAQKYQENVEDAKRRLLPSEDFPEKLVKAQEYEKLKEQGIKELPMTAEEYVETVKMFHSYTSLLEKALKEYTEEPVTLEIEPLSESAFGRLMASNDWTLSQVDLLALIME